MNNINKIVAALFLVSATHIAGAATPIYQLTNSQGAFLQVPLTHDIYRYSHQENLGDLVILDREQNSLAYRLISVSPTVEEKEPSIISDHLAFYPVAPDATPDTLRKLHTTQVKVQGNSVQISTDEKSVNNQTPEFYLIDISKLDHDINSLSVDWVAQPNNQYLEVELEATRNLQEWISLGRKTLVLINQQDQVLKHNHLDANISKKEYEFLRLKVVRGADNLQITDISSEQKIGMPAEVKRLTETWTLPGTLAKIQTSVYFPNSHSKTVPVSAWEFTREEAAPINTVAIDFGNNTYGDIAKIFSRSSENQNWQLLQQGIWFNAQVGDQWQKSDAINGHHNTDKYWRIELNESAKSKINPGLVFGWEPTQLQIIANNKAPYTLAIDSGNNRNHEQVFAELLGNAKPTWVFAGLTTLNVNPNTIITENKQIDWRQWIFWAALLSAVVLLLFFSLKLFKQMKESTEKEPVEKEPTE